MKFPVESYETALRRPSASFRPGLSVAESRAPERPRNHRRIWCRAAPRPPATGGNQCIATERYNIYPIGSMVLVYMLTWLGYIDGIHVTIYTIHGSYGYIYISSGKHTKIYWKWPIYSWFTYKKMVMRYNPYGSKYLLRKWDWGMIWGVKYLLRQCSDPCVYIYMYNNMQ